MPDEYFKNGKLKPKKLPKIKMDVPSVSGRLNQRKKLLEEERNGNYAVLTMDSEESFGYVTRAAIKLFGICIGVRSSQYSVLQWFSEAFSCLIGSFVQGGACDGIQKVHRPGGRHAGCQGCHSTDQVSSPTADVGSY